MTVDQALFEMELVGHDFYLFSDADSGRPSVVYRRHAYDYGLIRLAADGGRSGACSGGQVRRAKPVGLGRPQGNSARRRPVPWPAWC